MNIPRIVPALIAVLMLSPAWGGDAEEGLAAYNSADYEKALALWSPLAESGNADSQFGLGQMYGNGFGVMMDDALAIKWYSLAADQGHANAQYNLAIMNQNGWGVPQSDAAAIQLFALAAEQGVVDAMVALGRFYEMDFSDEYDPVRAFKWFGVANMLGHLDAGARRDTLAAKMTAEQVAEANSLIEVWTDSHTALLAKK